MQNHNQNKIPRPLAVLTLSMAVFLSYNEIGEASMLAEAISRIRNIISTTSNERSESTTSDSVEEDYVIRVSNKSLIEKNSTSSDMITIDGDVLSVSVGPLRTSTDQELITNDNIQVYVVKKGDTIDDVARLYEVSRNTIIWANDIKGNKLTVGDTLLILPVSGVVHKIKKGDTLKSLAKKYSADEGDIADFNSLTKGGELAIGTEIIIPDGKLYFDTPAVKKTNTAKPKKVYASAGTGYFTRPILGGVKSQGIHGHNGVDIAAPVGTQLVAAAGGTVQVARSSGYNGGYGRMIIIAHPNGTQTVYGHLSTVSVVAGQKVVKGEAIGLSGNTGKSTGPHLHFEVRGAINPF